MARYKVWLTGFTCLLIAATGFTRDYYVDASRGSDAWTGTVDEPLATIMEAIVRAADNAEADNIYVAAETYSESVWIDESDMNLEGGYSSDFAVRDTELYPTINDGMGVDSAIWI